jgi:hypothetical protein
VERVREGSPFFDLIADDRLPVQHAMLLLRVCGIPKINFLSRSLPPRLTLNAMKVFDELVLRAALSKLGVSSPSDSALKQLALPISRSGFGLRRFEITCFPAFWSATAQSASSLADALRLDQPEADISSLVGPMLKKDLHDCHDHLRDLGVPSLPDDLPLEMVTVPFPTRASEFWEVYTSPKCRMWKLQRNLTRRIENGIYESLKRDNNFPFMARLVACATPNAGAWILASPSESALRLSDDDYRLAAFLRLGIPQPSLPVLCSCGRKLAGTSDHGLSCVHQRGRSVRFRHDAIVRSLARHISSAGGVVQVEPYDLQVDHGVRPDLSALLINSCFAVDAQVTHPASNTHAKGASGAPLITAKKSEHLKCQKYSSLARAEGLAFFPFSMESFGGIGPESSKLLKLISEQSFETPGCGVSPSYLTQTLSVCLQQGNARVLRDTRWRALLFARLH